MKTTGKYSKKQYRCKTCGYEASHGTNHWGEFYNTHCMGCGTYSTWECLEPMPEGYEKPEAWKQIKLGDVVTIIEGVKKK